MHSESRMTLLLACLLLVTVAGPVAGFESSRLFLSSFKSADLLGAHSQGLAARDQVDRFLCSHNSVSVIREIGHQGGVHELVPEIRSRIFHQRYIVPKLRGKAYR